MTDEGTDKPTDRGTTRRAFLRRTGLTTAGVAALTTAGTVTATTVRPAPALATPGGWRPDPDSPRFTLAVMPDTQYLFDEDRIHPAPLQASLSYLLDRGAADNIVFLAHLGDLTQNGQQGEIDRISDVFATLDRHGVPYSVLAGNHDVSGDDQRGDTPYLRAFGPKRFAHAPGYGGASADGYNSYHLFRAAGRDWLLLALDWRPSAGGLAWAAGVLRKHPSLPAILTTHELADTDETGHAVLSAFGQHLWDELVSGNDQIFLTLNGHFWPAGRAVLPNRAGHDVHVHLTNYQNRYYGGAAMIRLYRFDLARDTIDVETVAPWILGQRPAARNPLARQEIELTDPADSFSVPIDFADRFAGFAPVPPRPPRPVRDLLVPGTVAYWRFDDPGATSQVADRSGHGNHLTVDGTGTAPAWSADHHPDQPTHGSLYLDGRGDPLTGCYLRTGQGAPLNAATFRSGYTIEAFFKLPADWDPAQSAWTGLLSRRGRSGEAGRTGGDPQEPIATLSLSGDRELQWAMYPLNQNGASTNWGHELPLGTWWHVAVVNDGRHTVMYVDGCEVVRNPATPAIGITTLTRPWLLGGYDYGGTLNQVFHGWIGDVRIADRALPSDRFMLA
jgi:hypothetical protein